MHSRSQDKLDKDDPEKDKKDKKKEKRNSKHQESFDKEFKPADAPPQQSEAVILSETVTAPRPGPAPRQGWRSEVAESAVKRSRDSLGPPRPCPSVARCCRASQGVGGLPWRMRGWHCPPPKGPRWARPQQEAQGPLPPETGGHSSVWWPRTCPGPLSLAWAGAVTCPGRD